MATKYLTLNLTIDESSNKVLFAEASKDFIDVLLSFLTLPLATLVRLSDKNSLPCLDNLYKSVEDLADEYFKTAPCRGMLLWPRHAAESMCLDLSVNVEGNRALCYYTCSRDCYHDYLSLYANAQCDCGRKMSHKVYMPISGSIKNENTEGVFLTGGRYFITDNFTAVPSSIQAAINLLGGDRTIMSKLGERQVTVGLSEIISILHQSLVSEAALTNAFLVQENDNLPEKKNSALAHDSLPELCSDSDPSDGIVRIKLRVDKQKNKVVFAECKGDFIDILFSFLTYPSGFVIKSLNGISHVACLDNLYATVLSNPMADCFKAINTKEYLVNPMIPSHFELNQSFIKSEEVHRGRMRYYLCRNSDCDSTEVSLIPNVRCKCGCITNKRMAIMDPRSGANGNSSEGFVSDGMYIVSDDLVITPLCSVSTLIRRIASDDLVEVPFNIGKKEVLALLKAALGSQAALTNVFLGKEETIKDVASGIDGDCVLV
ncbi:hypothetical protein LUZ61_018846 [Rhynchospora tenuis]|uniref:DUF674 family protein n=1 Tax=Rhynchospora tenuis TaxID=198213 RepID=A0AAD5ZA32_9POAL|nr:hypothetical protein LUZ61_018846 [Rhynchospora tenuis]